MKLPKNNWVGIAFFSLMTLWAGLYMLRMLGYIH